MTSLFRPTHRTYFRVSMFILGFSAGTSFAQNIDSLMAIQAKADPHEKVYVQFDKSFYRPGQMLWFKAYLFRGLEVSSASKTLYVELVGDGAKVIRRFTAPIIAASAAGNILIPTGELASALYFHAYTISMLNGDTNFLYTHILPLNRPRIEAQSPNGNIQDGLSKFSDIRPGNAPDGGPKDLRLRFYPEGGELVDSLFSIIAFLVTGPDGLPYPAKGHIETDKGKVITAFSVHHDGMGSFGFTPVHGERYRAIWADGYGRQYHTDLPLSRPQGIVLRVIDTKEGKRFTLARSPGPTDALTVLHIIGSMNQQVVYQARVNFKTESSTLGNIPTITLPTGILQITLLDKYYHPLAERITFVNHHDFLAPTTLTFNQLNYAKRGVNEGFISVPTKGPSNLSMSITDAELSASSPYEDNIFSHILLTSELRGKILHPAYYLVNRQDSVAQLLDLVMLTHGWRRYNWELLLKGRALEGALKETNYLSLDGRIVGLPSARDVAGVKLSFILQTTDSGSNFFSVPVTGRGSVFLDGLIFYDLGKLYFQPHGKILNFDKSQFYVTNGLYLGPKQVFLSPENRSFTGEIDSLVFQKNLINASREASIIDARSKNQFTLKEVKVLAKGKSAIDKLDDQFSTGLFSGGDARKFDVAHDPFAQGAFTIFQYLQSRVPGLQITGADSGTPSLSWRGSAPTLYLDNVQTQVDFLSSLQLSNVAYIKVYDPGSAGVISNSGGGAIAIFTKRGGDNSVEKMGMSYVTLAGYSPVKEFSSSEYASSVSDNLPDLRSTLYWNASVVVGDIKHPFHFSFYNNDITRHFRVVIEGVTTGSQLIHVEKVF